MGYWETISSFYDKRIRLDYNWTKLYLMVEQHGSNRLLGFAARPYYSGKQFWGLGYAEINIPLPGDGKYRVSGRCTIDGIAYSNSEIFYPTNGGAIDRDYDFRLPLFETAYNYESSRAEVIVTHAEFEKYISTPPSTPVSITVPNEINTRGGYTVSWGSGSKATSYRLERKVNNESFQQIYSGSSREYTDTAQEDWETVQYRVRSYNSDGYSSYRTSDVVKVIHFPQLQFKVNNEIKTAEKGYVKIDGQLREIDKMWVKVNGELKEVE